jgi:hypothetical protein
MLVRRLAQAFPSITGGSAKSKPSNDPGLHFARNDGCLTFDDHAFVCTHYNWTKGGCK